MTASVPRAPMGLAAARAMYFGSIIFNAGFFLYIYFSFASLRKLSRLPADNSARKILIPYTIALLVLNTGYAVTQNINAELNLVENASEPHIEVVVRSVFIAVPVFANDLLFLYRVAVLVQWRVMTLIIPCLLYVACFVAGIVTLFLEARGAKDEYQFAGASPKGLVIAVGLTAVLNLILGTIIIKQLYYAVRAARTLGRGGQISMRPQQSRYMRVVVFISESAVLWVVTAVLLMATVATYSNAAPFFELLFNIVTVLSPALLTYQIALEHTRNLKASNTNVSKTDAVVHLDLKEAQSDSRV